MVLCVIVVAALCVAPASAFAATAHADTGVNPDCGACHKPHQAPTERSLLSDVTESEVCYVCHGDSAGSDWNVETGTNSFTGASMVSGHVLENAVDPDLTVDLTNSCTGCHGVHGDPDLRANLPANEDVAGTTIDPADPRSWCLACHNADHAWYAGSETAGVFSIDAGLKTAYEALIQDPTCGASHYPKLGTFPGSASNATYLASTHASGIDTGTVESLVSVPTEMVTRVQGDCLWCHASHRSTATHDGLLGEYRASTANDAPGGTTVGEYAQACFECHGNSSGTVYLPAATYTDSYWTTTVGAPDVYALVTDTSSARSGHRIRTAGAYYAVDSPLPCYECHNPHGSKNGNTLMISDALGGNLQPDGTAAQVRQFCFSCHTTGDATPAGWDTDVNDDGTHDDGAYTTTLANTAVGTTAVGISRTVAPSTSYLQLSGSSYHLQAATQSCLACHDDAHNPGSGASSGGKDCYICHSTYMDYMEDGTDRDTSDTEAGVGSSRTTRYHHVVGSDTKDGDEAVGGTDSGNLTSYPAAGTDVYCLSCHVDHDKFNSSKSSSLRSTIAGTDTAPGSVTAASSDFNVTSGGVCLGCHYLSRTKDIANQKSDSTSVTPVIPDTMGGTLADAITAYGNSPHQYGVTGRARSDNTTFSGDCSKCHSDGQTGLFYKTATTGAEFGLHYDTSRRILEALGRGTVSDPYVEERFCYSCHSVTSDGFKSTANRDWYGDADGAMDLASQAIYAQTGPSAPERTSGHMVDTYTGLHRPSPTDESGTYIRDNKHVECADCHSPHAAGATLHTVGGANGNRIGTNSPLQGAWGVEPTTWPTWASPTGVYGVGSVKEPAIYEYQICFKCHSGYNLAYAAGAAGENGTWSNGWGSSGVNLWTDVALEFNPANASYHPVVAGTGRADARITAATGTMTDAWRTEGQTMTCSDCHQATNASSTAYGPHGSAVKKILRGYWPTNSPDGTGAYYTLGGDYTNLLCANCHQMANIGDFTTGHQTDHHGINGNACVNCHLVVPHGGKLAGLIGDGDDDNTDGDNGTGTTMPSRYAQGNVLDNTMMTGYNPGGATKPDCGTTCGHSVTAGADW